jgi:galactofuranosylgalactofuranosylrhamnosyl-N-acetylglucosaminyl-diphospho-decaprenol beta-1,5/1,6-galactofuranosyltransferase
VIEQRSSLVQRMLFTGLQPTAPPRLYVRTAGPVLARRAAIQLGPRSWASTNTYFGRFPASYWQRWTDVPEITLRLTYQGQGEMVVWASDAGGGRRPVRAATLDGGGQAEISIALDCFLDGGGLWAELRTEGGTLTVDDAGWFAVGVSPDRAQVAITTFNRPADCVASLRTLVAETAVADVVAQVIVVDQGTDGVEEHPDFPQAAAAWGSRLTYLRQRNLGGAGGFARGMVEAVRSKGTVGAGHVLLMDDDITLEPDTVLRLVAFADATSMPTIVGGQMLYAMHPQVLHVAAETADLPNLRAGRPTCGSLWSADLTKKTQEVRVDATYNGWWCCLVPHDVLERVGLPLPMFFQWDDIEFGYRALGRGVRTVTLHGAGVWHDDFAWKDRDDWFRYFSQRNSMITYALHGEFDATLLARQMWMRVVKAAVSMQYGLARTLVAAMEDFLEGPAVLDDGGVEALAEVRRLRAAYPETQLVSPGTPEALDPPAVHRPRGTPTRPLLVLAKRVTYQALGRTGGSASVPVAEAHWWHVSLFERAFVTDASQRGVRVRTLDRAEARAVATHAARVCLSLARDGDRVAQAYREAADSLSSPAAWSRRLGLPEGYSSTPPLASASPEAK